MSPTELSLRELRNRGWPHQVVEYWHAFANVRKDLFGFIDIVAITDDHIMGIQATSYENVSARRKKIVNECGEHAAAWLRAGGTIEVWGWYKKKARWTCRYVGVALTDFGE